MTEIRQKKIKSKYKKSIKNISNKLIAIGQEFKDSYEVKQADKYIKSIDKKAEYYFESEYGVVMLSPYNKPIESVEKGFLYTIYEINGKYYKSCGTNKHSELVKFFDLIKKKRKQLSIFDLISEEEELLTIIEEGEEDEYNERKTKEKMLNVDYQYQRQKQEASLRGQASIFDFLEEKYVG